METGRGKAGTEEDAFEKVELNGENVKIRRSTGIWIKDKIKEILTEHNSPAYWVDKHHAIYEFKVGKGQKPKYLVTDPKTAIDLGDNELILKGIKLKEFEKQPSKEFLEKTLKKYGIKKVDDAKDIIEQFYPLFFKIEDAVPEDDFKKLKDLSSEKINKFIDKTLEDGYKKDKEILYLLKAYLLRYDKNSIDHEEAMPYNPHAILYTNSSVGKSFTAKKIGYKKDRISPSKLLGWAGAEKKVEGFLNNKSKAVLCDEFQEDERDNLLSRGLPLLQDGESDTETGMANINTKTWSPLVVMSNPKRETGNEELIQRFMNTLEKLGDNYGAFGSRVGVVVFREDFETVKKGNLMSKEKNDRMQKVMHFLMDKIAQEFSELVKTEKLRSWLNKDYGEDYKEEVRKRVDTIGFTNVKEFWLNHLNSYRHARGHALRSSLLENISDILNDDYEIEEIKSTAKDEFDRLKEINKKSLRKMAEMAEEGEAKIAKEKLTSFSPQYARYFVMAICLEDNNKSLERNKYHPIEKVRDTYLDNKERMGMDKGSKYRKFAQVVNKLEGIRKKKRIDIKNKFGVEVKEVEDNLMFSIKDPTEFNKYSGYVTDVTGLPNNERGGEGEKPPSKGREPGNFGNLKEEKDIDELVSEEPSMGSAFNTVHRHLKKTKKYFRASVVIEVLSNKFNMDNSYVSEQLNDYEDFEIKNNRIYAR